MTAGQAAVVAAPPGPLLVLAGPGSGKTRTLTARVARFIAEGVAPQRLLLLTFSRRAAREMLQRVEAMTGVPADRLQGGTFHSVGRRLLRDHGQALGLPPQTALIDEEDALLLLKEVIQEVGKANASTTTTPPAKTLQRLWSFARNTLRPLDEVCASRYPQGRAHVPWMQQVCGRYETRKAALGLLDFDDLLTQWLAMIQAGCPAQPGVLGAFDALFVDEVQDTNRLQGQIIDTMVLEHQNLTLVGDDAQAIYGFRGADDTNLLGFSERYPRGQVLRLEESFRSSPQIIAAANASIRRNRRQLPKTLFSRQREGNLPACVPCAGEEQEALFVVQRLLEVHESEVPLSRIAVLFRSQRHAMALQLELSRRRIPFVVRAGLRFFEQRHIKDVLAFLRLVRHPRDTLSALRVLCMAEGVGPGTARKLAARLEAHEHLEAALLDPGWIGSAPPRARGGIEALRQLLLGLCTPAMRADAAGAIDRVRDAFYDAFAERTFELQAGTRLRELDALSAWAAQHGSVDLFLDALEASGVLSGEDILMAEVPEDALVLSTVHQAKGLEFHSVFVIGLCEDRFPSQLVGADPGELEEERRLFYVAITRAERELYLTWPMVLRDRHHGAVLRRESPFLAELRAEATSLLERWQLE